MFNILIDVIPSKYRKIVYALVALLSLGFSIWQAKDGDWGQFIIGLIASLTTTTASVNTTANPLYSAGSIVDPDDGVSYEDAGGADVPVHSDDISSGTPEETGVYDPGVK